MIYLVQAVKQTFVTVEVDAASAEAAVESALMQPRRNWDEWETEIMIQSVEPK